MAKYEKKQEYLFKLYQARKDIEAHGLDTMLINAMICELLNSKDDLETDKIVAEWIEEDISYLLYD